MKLIHLDFRKIGVPENFNFYILKNENGLSKELDENGFREPHNSKYTYEFVNKEDVVLDIGANLGYFALLCKKAKKIICVEPISRIIPVLKKNLKKNGLELKCEVINAAVGSKNKNSFLEIGSSLNSSKIVPKKSPKTIKIRSLSLKDLVKKYSINTLRMDLEGYEYELLLNNIPKKVNKIMMEFHSQRMKKNQIKELLNYLDREGFLAKYMITFFPKKLDKHYFLLKRFHLDKLFFKIFEDINMKSVFENIKSYKGGFLIKLYSKYKLKSKRDCFLLLERKNEKNNI